MKVNFIHLAAFTLVIGVSYSAFSQTWDRIGNNILATDYLGSQTAFPLQLRTTQSQPILFQTAGANERMRITPTGLLGLGTTAPVSLLHLNSATAAAINSRFTNSITGITAADGFQLGITNTGAALHQQHYRCNRRGWLPVRNHQYRGSRNQTV